ncbi:MAG: gliding motility-associated C-terminal domain-containing protein [Chitinophagales bacterium]|nr:gliding motility-associated C-terminal domain-containing protein [Chitinophagales bacterium]
MKYLSFIVLFLSLSLHHSLAQCVIHLNGQASNYTICEGDLPGILTNPTGLGTFSGPGVIGNIFNPINIPGEFVVTYVANGCNISQIITVQTVGQYPEINPFPPIICANDEPITLTGNVPAAVFTLENGIILPNGVLDPSLYPTGSPLIINYSYNAPNGCVSSDQATITILNIPTIDFSNFPSMVCENADPVELPHSILYTYSGTNINDNIFTPTEPATYTVTVTAGAGSCLTTATANLTVVDAAPLSITNTNGTCANLPDTILYNGTNLGENATYTWQIPTTAQLISIGGDTIVVDYQGSGEQIINLTIDNTEECVENTANFTISTQQISVNTITDQHINIGQTIELTTEVEVSPPDLTPSISWTPSTDLSCDDCLAPEYSPSIIGEHEYIVTASLDGGCIASDTVRVSVIFPNEVFIPNIFTPNDDSENDNFLAFGLYTQTMNMKIFDRWGSLIFETNNIEEGWNGTYQNRRVNTGTYIYLITITDENGTQEVYQGDVTVAY